MKITTEGLTLGIIQGLQRSGYKVEIEESGEYANITKEASVSVQEGVSVVGGYGDMA